MADPMPEIKSKHSLVAKYVTAPLWEKLSRAVTKDTTKPNDNPAKSAVHTDAKRCSCACTSHHAQSYAHKVSQTHPATATATATAKTTRNSNSYVLQHHTNTCHHQLLVCDAYRHVRVVNGTKRFISAAMRPWWNSCLSSEVAWAVLSGPKSGTYRYLQEKQNP